MIRIVADKELCIGSGSCAAAAPDVFDLGPDRVVLLLKNDVGEDERGPVQDAIDLCPVEALTLEAP